MLLYLGPYLVLERQTKFFHLQLGDRMDIVSVNRLKPAFLDEPISPALPPLPGCLPLPPVLVPCQPPPPLSAVARVAGYEEAVNFHLPPEVPSGQNLHCAAHVRRLCSALPFLLGGVLWWIHDDQTNWLVLCSSHNNKTKIIFIYAMSSISCYSLYPPVQFTV